MSQTWDVDLIVPASTSPVTDIVRLVDAHNTLRSNWSGTVEPAAADRVAYMWWADTTTGLLKIRNAANTAWVTVGTLATENLGLLGMWEQLSKSIAYTTVLLDRGKHILHPTADNNARTFTIDSNANVPYPIGTEIMFVNQINVVTIAITTDTMTLNPAGTTGSRTLAANGNATALKVSTTGWIISGFGLT